MPKILLKLEGKVVREYSLKGESTTIGRKPDNDIVINNPAVSGYHCKIVLKGDTYSIEDLDSTNGTAVNSKRIQKCGLHQDDVIGIAKHQLIFLEDASHAAIAAHSSSPKIEEKPVEPVADADSTHAPRSSDATGVLKILKGGEVNKEYEVKGNSLYIGKSDRAQIPIEGSGLFGSAPDVAASVHRKAEGFLLVAVEDGYPIVAGSKVHGKVQLKNGDIIECGNTTLQFSLKD